MMLTQKECDYVQTGIESKRALRFERTQDARPGGGQDGRPEIIRCDGPGHTDLAMR